MHVLEPPGRIAIFRKYSQRVNSIPRNVDTFGLSVQSKHKLREIYHI